MPPRKRTIENANVEPLAVVPPVTPKKMKVTELREALTAHGLSPKGLKKELVDRLEGFIDGKAAPTPLKVVATIDSSQDESTISEQTLKSPTRARNTTRKAILEEEKVDYSMEPEEDSQVLEMTVESIPIDFQDPTKPRPELATESKLEPQPELATDSKLEPEFRTEFVLESNPESTTNLKTEHITDSSLETVVHITNFVRPFAVPAVRSLVGQFGTMVDFWMDQLRTNCFVQFETPDAADSCTRKLGGIKWPFDTGKCLQTSKSNQKTMALAKEEGSVSRAPKSNSTILEQPIILDALFLKTNTTPHLYYLPAVPLE